MFDLGSMIGGIAQAGAGVWQGYLNQQSQRDTNAMQIDLANTAVQRRQADLKAAGINPLLAGTQGGAQTPTLQAPQMQGLTEAVGRVAEPFTQRAQLGLQQQAMNVQETEAQIKKIEAEKDKAIADAMLTKTTNEWYGPRTTSEINLQGANTKLAEENTRKAEADRLTTEALRLPQVQKLQAEIEQTAAQTSKTLTENELAKKTMQYAVDKYGADAKKAATEAAMLATDYREFFLKRKDQEVKTSALQYEILTSELGQKLIAQALEAKYGEHKYLLQLTDNPLKLFTSWGIENAKKMEAREGGANLLNLNQRFGPTK